jgi:hypothetical protein
VRLTGWSRSDPTSLLPQVTLLTSPGLAFLAPGGACGRLIMPCHRYATATAATRTPDAASRLLDAGMDGEDIDQLGNGKNSQHLVLRGGQPQVTPGAPGLPPDEHQGCHAAGVDELQASQVDDDRLLAGHDRHERGRGAGGVCYVKLPAQLDDSPSVAAGTQIYADHRSAFLLQQQGGDLTQRLVRQFSL